MAVLVVGLRPGGPAGGLLQWPWLLSRLGLGLLHAGSGGDEKEEAEETGDAKTRLDITDDAEVVACDALGDGCDCARLVSSARPRALDGTAVAVDPDDIEEDMDEPRSRLGERRRDDDLGTCDNSPTKPGPFPLAKSNAGLKLSIAPFAKLW